MKKIKPFLFVSISGIIIIFFSACEAPMHKTYNVKYEITGPEGVADSIHYLSPTGYPFIYNENVPWSFTFDVSGTFLAFACEAIFYNNLNNNSYTVKIYLNGNEVASSTDTLRPYATYNTYQ